MNFNEYKDDEESKKLFISDALIYLNIQDHPKANKAVELAWEFGRDDGYEGIFLLLEDLSRLMEK